MMRAWAHPAAIQAISSACLRPSFKAELLSSGGAWSSGYRHPSSNVHPSAVVHSSAVIDEGALVGPMCVVGPGVIVGSGVQIHSHSVVYSNTVLGNECKLHSFSCVGGDPQDLKYRGGDSWLILGEKCTVREHTTLNRGTEIGGGFTMIGRSCLVMSSVHIGHDCKIGNNVVLSTGASLAGHCTVEDRAILGGQVGVRQFVKIGTQSMVGGKSAVLADVVPFSLIAGNPAHTLGLNLVGLRRARVPKDEISKLSNALRYVMQDVPRGGPNTMLQRAEEALKLWGEGEGVDRVNKMIKFIMDGAAGRGVCAWGRAPSKHL